MDSDLYAVINVSPAFIYSDHLMYEMGRGFSYTVSQNI